MFLQNRVRWKNSRAIFRNCKCFIVSTIFRFTCFDIYISFTTVSGSYSQGLLFGALFQGAPVWGSFRGGLLPGLCPSGPLQLKYKEKFHWSLIKYPLLTAQKQQPRCFFFVEPENMKSNYFNITITFVQEMLHSLSTFPGSEGLRLRKGWRSMLDKNALCSY